MLFLWVRLQSDIHRRLAVGGFHDRVRLMIEAGVFIGDHTQSGAGRPLLQFMLWHAGKEHHRRAHRLAGMVVDHGTQFRLHATPTHHHQRPFRRQRVGRFNQLRQAAVGAETALEKNDLLLARQLRRVMQAPVINRHRRNHAGIHHNLRIGHARVDFGRRWWRRPRRRTGLEKNLDIGAWQDVMFGLLVRRNAVDIDLVTCCAQRHRFFDDARIVQYTVVNKSSYSHFPRSPTAWRPACHSAKSPVAPARLRSLAWYMNIRGSALK